MQYFNSDPTYAHFNLATKYVCPYCSGAAQSVVHSLTVQAGPNIAVAKYWGKRDGMALCVLIPHRVFEPQAFAILSACYSWPFELANKFFPQFYTRSQVGACESQHIKLLDLLKL